MSNLVSVVVPVYNTRDYLEKCVNSILSQTHKEIELILVDDGSTDGSAELCDRLQTLDSRILVIHKKNSGVVLARLSGLEQIKGDYAILIDSDDWIEPEMLKELYEKAIQNDADIVTSGFYREKDTIYDEVTDGIEEGVYYNASNMSSFFKSLIYYGTTEKMGICGGLWCKLIKKDLLKEVHMKMDHRIAFAEDAAIVYSCCVRAKTIVVTHNVYYHYVMRVGSTVYKNNEYYYSNINELYLFLKNEFEKSEFASVLIKQLDLFMTSLVFRGLNHYFGLNNGISIPYYDFDKTMIEKDAKVVLYGAGRVGKAYHEQICADKMYHLVGWVDKEYLYYQQKKLQVSSPEILSELEYDWIILGFKYEDLADSVKEELVKQYGIEEKKMIWLRPVNIIDKYNTDYETLTLE